MLGQALTRAGGFNPLSQMMDPAGASPASIQGLAALWAGRWVGFHMEMELLQHGGLASFQRASEAQPRPSELVVQQVLRGRWCAAPCAAPPDMLSWLGQSRRWESKVPLSLCLKHPERGWVSLSLGFAPLLPPAVPGCGGCQSRGTSPKPLRLGSAAVLLQGWLGLRRR